MLKKLGDISVEEFLAEYWQKKPLLIRNAFKDFTSSISSDELAGLSCDEDVESRLVLGGRPGAPWELRHGPFSDKDFRDLPASHWTLLVQAVDHWVPEVRALLDHFRFIPNWRVDDIMISYAADQGSVGPHYDHYDVFLLQGAGQREWQIGEFCWESSSLLKDTPLRILSEFSATNRWTLSPGDMLYLPPKVAHWGVAQGDCLTYSIGFRSLSTADILLNYSQELSSYLSEEHRYTDADLPLQKDPGEINNVAIEKLHTMLLEAVQDKKQFTHWLGRFTTENKYAQLDTLVLHEKWENVLEQLMDGANLFRNESSRFAYTRSTEGSTTENNLGIDFCLYVDGEIYSCTPAQRGLAVLLCKEYKTTGPELISATQNSESQDLLVTFINKGILYLE